MQNVILWGTLRKNHPNTNVQSIHLHHRLEMRIGKSEDGGELVFTFAKFKEILLVLLASGYWPVGNSRVHWDAVLKDDDTQELGRKRCEILTSLVSQGVGYPGGITGLV